MPLNSLPWTTAAPDDERDAQQTATCPLCHTDASVTRRALEAGGVGWRCARCGQHWDAGRLATARGYAGWLSTREPAGVSTPDSARHDPTLLPPGGAP